VELLSSRGGSVKVTQNEIVTNLTAFERVFSVEFAMLEEQRVCMFSH